MKFLIVEDEPIEQQALCLLLEQFPHPLGHSIEIRVAAHATAFYDTVCSWNPDVVLLDIRIPGGNGLSVLEKVRQNDFNGRVLILSAYDSFEYAQQALSLGASAFLVKPVAAEQLYDALQKILSAPQPHATQMSTLQHNSAHALCARVLLADLANLETDQRDQEIQAIAAESSLFLDFPYHVLAITFPEPLQADEKKNSFHFSEKIAPLLQNTLFVPWNRHSGLLFISTECCPSFEALLAQISFLMEENAMPGHAFFLTTAEHFEQLRELTGSLDDIFEESRLMDSSYRAHPDAARYASLLNPFCPNSWIAAKTQITEGFRTGNSKLIYTGEEELGRSLDGFKIDTEFSKMLLLGLFGEICDILLSLQCDLDSVRAWSRRQMLNLLAAHSVSLFPPLLRNCLEEGWKIRDSFHNEQIITVSLALEYIHKHFDEATLESTAKHVHVSTAHLSRLFVKVLQRKFIDIVKEKRIERARELLLAGTSVRDVALQVGYGNIAYFSTLFKQMCGISPSEYGKQTHATPLEEDVAR